MNNNFLEWGRPCLRTGRYLILAMCQTQMKRIEHAIAPGIKGDQPQNLVYIVPPGTVKTTSFNKIIEEAEEISPSDLIIAMSTAGIHRHISQCLQRSTRKSQD